MMQIKEGDNLTVILGNKKKLKEEKGFVVEVKQYIIKKIYIFMLW